MADEVATEAPEEAIEVDVRPSTPKSPSFLARMGSGLSNMFGSSKSSSKLKSVKGEEAEKTETEDGAVTFEANYPESATKQTDGEGEAWQDTNVGMIGSDEDKAARKEAAETEAAWQGAGQAPGIEIWRIEKFMVVPWPKSEYGSFFSGDSYIVLHTHKESEESEELEHDLYFWLGADTSQDEQGTAAYKTVELDDLLDGEPEQHREVMMHESPEFKNLFPCMRYMKGGVDSGFNHVEAIEADTYVPKLMHVKKIDNHTCVMEVATERASLNHADAFFLDAGAKILVWFGDECSPFEKAAANAAAEELEATRNGHSSVALVDGDSGAMELFWEKLGGEGDVTSAADAPAMLPEPLERGEGVLYKLSDSEEGLVCSEVARGELDKSMLESSDVFLCDTGCGLLVWVGKEASTAEQRNAMSTAVKYLGQQDLPPQTPISVFREASAKPCKNPLFNEIFAD